MRDYEFAAPPEQHQKQHTLLPLPTCSCSWVPCHGRGASPGAGACSVFTLCTRNRANGRELLLQRGVPLCCGVIAGSRGAECIAVLNMLIYFTWQR